ncbi:MAG: hypothetical protein N3D20_00020 [Candidatus Pacearchaeota archaeon]|nr:hypothetical protein [Candidatus Pacearchaeota archaeon]
MIIKEVRARIIKDSRNEPTIEVSVNNQKASSPSGKSKGKHETPSYNFSLDWNVNVINKLKIPFEINSFNDLSKIESLIKKKFNLKDAKQFGANALFALESAILKALAKENKKELWQVINPNAKKFPIPVGNAIGGGLHSAKFKKHPVFQEFLLIPNEKSFKDNVKSMQDNYKTLKLILNTKQVNDEGALQCSLNDEEILEILSNLTNTRIGIDVASSSFFKNGIYNYKDKQLDREAQIHYMNSLINDYDLFYLEDPLNEEDFLGFSKIVKKHLIIGDDLTTTNIRRLKKAIKMKSINAMIIKPNQNGSLFEVAKIFKICKKHKIKTIISHRSGETLDNALADYAFAFQADFIKTGIATKWREVKLNRLIDIEKSLK